MSEPKFMPFGARTARRLRQQIIDRDGTDCCICFAPIDMTIPARDEDGKRSRNLARPTFEHRKRLIEGGAEADIDNLGLAHEYCNRALGHYDGCLDHRIKWPGGRGKRTHRWTLRGWPGLPLDFVDWDNG